MMLALLLVHAQIIQGKNVLGILANLAITAGYRETIVLKLLIAGMVFATMGKIALLVLMTAGALGELLTAILGLALHA